MISDPVLSVVAIAVALHQAAAIAICCCDRRYRNNLSRLWVAAIRCHSPSTFSSPRNRKRRRPWQSLICPFTGSTKKPPVPRGKNCGKRGSANCAPRRSIYSCCANRIVAIRDSHVKNSLLKYLPVEGVTLLVLQWSCT
jgi:hypothetical protein